MATFKLVVAYNGTNFCGWQKQSGNKLPSLQEILESAVSRILCEQTGINASGRTDAGVHSIGQVASFRTGVERSPKNILLGLNSLLPENIRILSVRKAADGFHPQFRAKKKTYRYLLQNGAAPSPLLLPYSCFFSGKMDLRLMRKAAAYLVGRHDFTAFQSSGRTAKDPVRTIYRLTVRNIEDGLFRTPDLVDITVVGNGFLYKMVRNIVGTLLEVGRGKIKPEEIKKILESGDRRKAGPAAPARGLTLMRVQY